MGFQYINEEQKIRIPLSRRAYIVMTDDMRVFSVARQASFINTVIANFHDRAKASLSLYLTGKRHEFEALFTGAELDGGPREAAISHMLSKEKEKTIQELQRFLQEKYISKLYHINDTNYEYLRYDCNEEEFYNEKAGAYIKCLLEEYAELPFIKRERIFRREVYETVEYACRMHFLLQVKTLVYGQRQTFLVYPYKIVPDPLCTQEYLACYTRTPEKSAREKKDASFSMARLEKPVVLKQSAFLSKAETAKIEDDIAKLTVAFLLGEPQEIRVRLTERGKRSFQTRLYSRPDKDEGRSTDEEYVFSCSEQQAYFYFMSFGAEAEIISPASLRERMMRYYQNALERYLPLPDAGDGACLEREKAKEKITFPHEAAGSSLQPQTPRVSPVPDPAGKAPAGNRYVRR